MIPGFGKQTIVLGSAPDCDIVLTGPGVAPHHARIVHHGGGQLVFVDNGQGPSTAAGRPIPPGQSAPYDLATPFTVGQGVGVPLGHPAIALMLMAPGQKPSPPGQLLIGREASQATLVVQHPGVSAQHALVALDRMHITDLGSTSGVYVGGARIAPNQPVPIDPNGFVVLGRVAVGVSLLMQVADALARGPAAAHAAGPPPGAPHAASPGAATPAPKKHQTVIGQLDFSAGPSTKSIGRTPDNDIVVNHPQVSSKHAV